MFAWLVLIMPIEMTEVFLLGFLSVLALGFAGPLCVLQIRNLKRGITHIERCRKPVPTEYNMGPRENFRSVFGDGVWFGCLSHLLPLPHPPIGDGVHFQRQPAARLAV